jgi:aspartyl-tRNA(Asn)/glutamyl-tRNA(Gln) amidotransferase subunit C
MKLSTEEIEDIARLARLELSEAEKTMYAEQLSAVLDYMKILDEVDTTNVEETTQVTGLMDVTREDDVEVISEEQRKNLLASFPERNGEMLEVKEVFAK